MNRSSPVLLAFFLTVFVLPNAHAMEVSCAFSSGGKSLSCQITTPPRRVMHPEDIGEFLEAKEIFVTLVGASKVTRIFQIDRNAPEFKHLEDLHKSGSISEIEAGKLALFAEIERKLIETSNKLDAAKNEAKLVLYDSSITYEKLNGDRVTRDAEIAALRKGKEQACMTLPAVEKISNANSKLQQALSNILYAFQTPDSCMAGFKVFKDRDGTVDLRQLNDVSTQFRSQCTKR